MGSGPLALAPEIDQFRRQFEKISADADALAARLSDEQFNWRPAPAKWSIGDCFDHLNATARMYLPRLDEAIAEAIRRGLYGAGPFRYSWLGLLIVRTSEPPPTIRLRAPATIQPQQGRSRHDVMAAMRGYQVQYVDRLRQANGLDLARARVKSPVASWVRFSLGSGFALMAAHERRHLWQAERISQAPGFPVSERT